MCGLGSGGSGSGEGVSGRGGEEVTRDTADDLGQILRETDSRSTTSGMDHFMTSR